MKTLTIDEVVILETVHGFDLELEVRYDLERIEPVAVDVGFGQNFAVEPGYEKLTVTHVWVYGKYVSELTNKIQKAVDDGYLELG